MIAADAHDLAGAFAVDALTREEREAFLRHAADCADCAHEVAQHQQTATWLALAAARTPPPDLKDRVLAEVARTPQLRATLPGREGVHRGRRFTPRLLNLALAACLAAAAAFGGLAAWQHQEAQQARQEASSRTADFARLLAAPDTSFVRQDVSYGGSGTVAVSRRLDQAAYFCEDLAPLPPDRTYQLWYIAPGNQVRSAGLLPARTALQAVSLPPPGAAASLAITVEPGKGSAEPSSKPLATWPLPAA
ncbi:anti-sigma factor domain-containing protein [Streptomyces coerulescens]|uniref:Regulator of SigK n=1 Tax=Streptomyces coerulescens TaxID=29304 RepID=A0ABW0CDJ0_STRCD